MAEDTGFEPVITESKSAALGQTKLIPNNITIIKFTANHSHLLFTGCDPALCAVITYKLSITVETIEMCFYMVEAQRIEL